MDMPVVERAAAQPSQDGLSLVTPEFAGEAAVTPWSVEPLQYGTFLCSIFDHWVQHDVARYYVQIFDVALENWLGMCLLLYLERQRERSCRPAGCRRGDELILPVREASFKVGLKRLAARLDVPRAVFLLGFEQALQSTLIGRVAGCHAGVLQRDQRGAGGVGI